MGKLVCLTVGQETLLHEPGWIIHPSGSDGRIFRPSGFVTLAVPQIGTPALPTFQFPGPYSISELENRISEFKTSLRQSLSDLKLKEDSGRLDGASDCQCSDIRGGQSLQSQMSQTPVTSGPESASLQEAKQIGYFSKPPTLPSMVETLRTSSPRPIDHGNSALGKPPGPTIQSRGNRSDTPSNDAEQSLSRPIRMHNILNPADDRMNQRSVAQLDSPQTSVSSSSWRPSDRSAQSQSPSSISTHSTNMPISRMYPSSSNPVNRQNGTSGSSMNHINGLGTLSLPNATIDAKESPFLYSRNQNSTLGASSISLPAVSAEYKPPISLRSSFGSMSQNGTPPDRRGAMGVPSATSSQCDSPGTSYSSYSQMSRASPSSQPFNVPTTQPVPSAHYSSLATTRAVPSERHPISLTSELSYGSVSSAVGHSTYQLMAFDTDQGPIQVPVDVQAASKMADEKRKRNAGASQRFRQRRKDKERESSTTISKLETQLREMSEEREYYRVERDYFRGIVYNSPAQAQVVPRLPSPRQRKFSQSGNVGTMVDSQWQQSEERGGQAGRNTRRRISAYGPGYENQAQTAVAAPTPSPGYPPTPPLQFSHPLSRASNSGARPPTSALPPARPSTHDPPPLPSWNPAR